MWGWHLCQEAARAVLRATGKVCAAQGARLPAQQKQVPARRASTPWGGLCSPFRGSGGHTLVTKAAGPVSPGSPRASPLLAWPHPGSLPTSHAS